MENKKIKPELVISDEKEIIRELSEAVLNAVELTAREAFYAVPIGREENKQ